MEAQDNEGPRDWKNVSTSFVIPRNSLCRGSFVFSHEMRIFGIVYLSATRSTITVVKLNLEKPFVEIKWFSPAMGEHTSGGTAFFSYFVY